MYFVNRSEIEATIKHIQHILDQVKKLKTANTILEQFALERMTHVIIESILDVGNMMIDGFIMRDPGSYHDIIDILIDERVISASEEDAYKQLIDLRRDLVQSYQTINHKKMLDVLQRHMDIYDTFEAKINHYLASELDVANAFSNEE